MMIFVFILFSNNKKLFSKFKTHNEFNEAENKILLLVEGHEKKIFHHGFFYFHR